MLVTKFKWLLTKVMQPTVGYIHGIELETHKNMQQFSLIHN